MTKTKKQLKRIRNGNFVIMMILFAIIGILLFPHVQAQTIQMANPGSYGERDIQVFYVNGTLAGLYNTTSTITLDETQSYIFALVPQTSNPLDDPAGFISWLFAFATTNLVPLSILIFLAALWLGRR